MCSLDMVTRTVENEYFVTWGEALAVLDGMSFRQRVVRRFRQSIDLFLLMTTADAHSSRPLFLLRPLPIILEIWRVLLLRRSALFALPCIFSSFILDTFC